MMNQFENSKGKKVFISLKSGLKYNGVVKETTDNFLFILDKFDNKVVIRIDEISSLEEK
jgi:hypothetical protein